MERALKSCRNRKSHSEVLATEPVIFDFRRALGQSCRILVSVAVTCRATNQDIVGGLRGEYAKACTNGNAAARCYGELSLGSGLTGTILMRVITGSGFSLSPPTVTAVSRG